jgi:catechol 2,3-dioxygenase-like lactoylglutathione lyase family enzyme
MFDHVTIRVSDRAASERFYATVLATLGIQQTTAGARYTEWDEFSLAEATAAKPATIAPYAGLRPGIERPELVQFRGAGGSFTLVSGTPSENVHMAFPATDDATVEAFHRAAVAAGHRDDGAPGERPGYHAGYFAAYVLDPDGNSVEVVSHNRS